jgi:LysR family glycine cleavage system transcriptional activator
MSFSHASSTPPTFAQRTARFRGGSTSPQFYAQRARAGRHAGRRQPSDQSAGVGARANVVRAPDARSRAHGCGRAFQPALSRALDAIEEATATARGGPLRRRLSVSVVPSFAARWLLPRLQRFRTAHPGIDLHVSLSTELVPLARSGFDLGVRWGYGRYPGLAVWHIMDDEMFPVVSPKLRRSRRKLDPAHDLARWGLLHDDRHEHWVEWLERANVHGVPVTDGLVFNDASLMLQAAVEGLGIALGRRSLVAEDLRARRLVRVSSIALKTPESYWLAAPRARADDPSVRAFRTWLLAEAARS